MSFLFMYYAFNRFHSHGESEDGGCELSDRTYKILTVVALVLLAATIAFGVFVYEILLTGPQIK